MTRSVATETKVEVELDQQTKDELQPSCDCFECSPAGVLPAAWISLITCENCGPRHLLECETHYQMWFDGVPCDCARCDNKGILGEVRLVSAEPLR